MEAEEVVSKQEVRGVFGRLGKQEEVVKVKEEGEGRKKEQEARVTSTSEEKTHEELRSARASASPGRGTSLFPPLHEPFVNILTLYYTQHVHFFFLNRYPEEARCGRSWICHSKKQVCFEHYISEGARKREADKEDQLWRNRDANNGSQRRHPVETWIWQAGESSSRTGRRSRRQRNADQDSEDCSWRGQV